MEKNAKKMVKDAKRDAETHLWPNWNMLKVTQNDTKTTLNQQKMTQITLLDTTRQF